MTPETKFKMKVKKYLDEIGAYHVKQFGCSLTKRGVPDILACIGGYFVGIELKAENGKIDPLQYKNITDINQSGGKGMILYPSDFEDFKILCEKLLKNKR